MLADVMCGMTAASAPSSQRPKDSPMSQLMSIRTRREVTSDCRLQMLGTSLCPGTPPGDDPLFGEGADEHPQAEDSPGGERLREGKALVKWPRHQAVDHLDMNPVDEERRAPQLLERAECKHGVRSCFL